MRLYYGTFGIGSHLSEYYQPVYAKNEEQAYNKMLETWGKHFAFINTELEFSEARAKGLFLNLKPLPTVYATKVITVGEMKRLTDRFNQIVNASQNMKVKRLELLINDIEAAYKDDPFASTFIESIKEVI